MKAGDKARCAKCGNETYLVLKSEMNGWHKTGDMLACSICSAKIADLDDTQIPDNKKQEISERKSRLAEILGTAEEKKPEIIAHESELQFCRDCLHFIRHPFHDRCGLHDKTVEPMEDCPDFAKKN